MTSLCYLAAREQQAELARRAERVRQVREGEVFEPRRRSPKLIGRLVTALRPRRPAPAAPCR